MCLKCKSSFAMNKTPIDIPYQKIQCFTGTVLLEQYIVSNEGISRFNWFNISNKFDEFSVQIKDLVSVVMK